MTVNITMSATGAQPTPPATIRQNILSAVSAARPGYTGNLPGSLIEDVLGTDVAAVSLIDQAVIDLINSLSPNTANSYLLSLLGTQAGIAQGALSNSSAYIFFYGIAGYVIPKGFIVSDGSQQYTVQDGGILSNAAPSSYTGTIAGTALTVSAMLAGQIMIGDAITGPGIAANTIITGFTSGTMGQAGVYVVNNSQTVASPITIAGMTHGGATLFVVANNFGTWPIPANSITSIITSVPTGYPLTCTNQTNGTIASVAETNELYRARVNQAQLAPAVGTMSLLKSLIQNVPGVQSRLVSVSGAGKIIVGGGDPYMVASAIYNGLFDLGDLIGSSVTSHNWAATGSISGNVLTITAVSSGAILSGDFVAGTSVVNPTIILNQITAVSPAFPTGGGTGTYSINYAQTIGSEPLTGQNSNRNQVVSITNYPDTYWIPFVIPVSQTISIACNWSTIAPNFTANLAVSTLIQTAWTNYINSIPVGIQLNTFVLNQIFMDSIATIISPALISVLNFTVSINGVVTAVTPGTTLIAGDSEGYFTVVPAAIVLTRV